MIHKLAKQEIRKHLEVENFPSGLIDSTLDRIVKDIENYRRGGMVWQYEGVAKRLVLEYSNDKYQVRR